MQKYVPIPTPPKRSWSMRLTLHMRRYWQLYLLILPAFLFSLIFCYQPMYGAQIAFRNFKIKNGILGSEWVGLKHFLRFFESASFGTVIKNTLGINLCSLIIGFPLPIILALLLNETRSAKFRKGVQMVTYMPHFMSTVAVCGLTILFLDRDSGIINILLSKIGIASKDYMTDPNSFWGIYIITDIWQNLGWNAIIYVAALTSVDVEVIEAAHIDGVSRLQKIWYIDIPYILPTVIVLFILQAGKMMNIGFEKILLLQNALNMSASDVISTYVYRLGIEGAQYSYTTAIGLFNSAVNVIILIFVNNLANRLSKTSLW